MVHIIAKTLGGGEASGRGVGLVQVAPLFQIQHEVADGGRREVEARGLGHGPGPHRFPGNDVLGHHGFQDPGIPLPQEFHDASVPFSNLKVNQNRGICQEIWGIFALRESHRRAPCPGLGAPDRRCRPGAEMPPGLPTPGSGGGCFPLPPYRPPVRRCWWRGPPPAPDCARC